MESKAVTVIEAAALLHCSTDKIRRTIKARGIKALDCYIGKAKYYPFEELAGKKQSLAESLYLRIEELQRENEKLRQTLKTIAAVAEGGTV